jgi:hypothetical protein
MNGTYIRNVKNPVGKLFATASRYTWLFIWKKADQKDDLTKATIYEVLEWSKDGFLEKALYHFEDSYFEEVTHQNDIMLFLKNHL